MHILGVWCLGVHPPQGLWDCTSKLGEVLKSNRHPSCTVGPNWTHSAVLLGNRYLSSSWRFEKEHCEESRRNTEHGGILDLGSIFDNTKQLGPKFACDGFQHWHWLKQLQIFNWIAEVCSPISPDSKVKIPIIKINFTYKLYHNQMTHILKYS